MKKELNLFAVHYSCLDGPAIYAAYSHEHAEQSYMNDIRGFWNELDEELKVVELSPELDIEFFDEDEQKAITMTARELAETAIPGTAILWDRHYC